MLHPVTFDAAQWQDNDDTGAAHPTVNGFESDGAAVQSDVFTGECKAESRSIGPRLAVPAIEAFEEFFGAVRVDPVTRIKLAELRREVHANLKQANYDIARQQFNTVASAGMKMLNALESAQKLSADAAVRDAACIGMLGLDAEADDERVVDVR